MLDKVITSDDGVLTGGHGLKMAMLHRVKYGFCILGSQALRASVRRRFFAEISLFFRIDHPMAMFKLDNICTRFDVVRDPTSTSWRSMEQ